MPLTSEEIRKAYYEDSSIRFFGKIKKVLFSPSEFFDIVKSEQGLKGAFVYLAIISLIGISLFAIMLFLFLGLMFSFLGSFAGSSADQFTGFFTSMSLVYLGAIILGLWLATLLLSFVGAGILHIFVKIVGGNGSYSDTYKAAAYASTPSYVFIWVPIISIFISIWALYLEIKGLSVLHNISMKRATLAVFLPIIIILVLLFGLVFLFTPTYYDNIQHNIENNLENQTQSQIFIMGGAHIDSFYFNKIIIRNTDAHNISTAELSVYVNNTIELCSWDTLSFGPDEFATCTLQEPCYGKNVKVVAPGGSSLALCK